MIVFFSKEVYEDSKPLVGLADDVLGEFVAQAINNIKTGKVNKKLYARVADSLHIEPESVLKSIVCLSVIMLECAKKNCDLNDFRFSVQDFDLSPAQKNILAEAYSKHAQDIRGYLGATATSLTHYVNLDWRLDVQIASRCVRKVVEPSFVLELQTERAGASASAAAAASTSSSSSSSSKPEAAAGAGAGAGEEKSNSSAASSASSSSSSSSSSLLLQSDFANMEHLVSELSKAVKEAGSAHSRRILRFVK